MRNPYIDVVESLNTASGLENSWLGKDPQMKNMMADYDEDSEEGADAEGRATHRYKVEISYPVKSRLRVRSVKQHDWLQLHQPNAVAASLWLSLA